MEENAPTALASIRLVIQWRDIGRQVVRQLGVWPFYSRGV